MQPLEAQQPVELELPAAPLQKSTVVTLVNILVKVFHSRDGTADFNIDVALVPHRRVGVVRDDPTVVKDKARAARARGQQQEFVSHIGVPNFTSSMMM